MTKMTPAREPRHGRSGWRAIGAAAVALIRGNPVLPLIAGIGFAISFETITSVARQQHMPGWPILYPVVIDVFFLGAIIEARRAIDDDRSDLAPRIIAWALAGLTIYVNAHGSPLSDWVGVSLHVIAPVAWIVFLELTRWRKVRRTAHRRDRIPLARWLNYPLSSLGIYRRMVQHDITSYRVASVREEARSLAIDLARVVYGRRWRRDAPLLLRHQLRHGTLPPAVARASTAPGGDVAGAVDEWVRAGHRQRAATAALARQDERATAGAAGAPRQRATVRPRRATSSTPAPAARRATAERIADANPGIKRADLMAQVPGLTPRTADRILSARRPLLTVAR